MYTKTSLLFLILLIASIGANAQNIGFGIKAGYFLDKFQVTNDVFNVSEESEWANGYKAGFFLYTNTESLLDFEAGAEFAIYKIKLAGESANANFIQAPFLAKINLTEQFHVVAGPVVGYLVNDQDIEKLKIDASVGIGYRTALGHSIRLSAAYGINNLAPNALTDFNGAPIGKTSGRFVEVSLGMASSF